MFKALREKSKEDSDIRRESLQIRVADLETQGLLESESATLNSKNQEIEKNLAFMSEEYDHLLPWIKQMNVDTESIEKRVEDLEIKKEAIKGNRQRCQRN